MAKFKKVKKSTWFLIVGLLIFSGLFYNSCRRSKLRTVDRRDEFHRTNDSLDAISRDTIFYKVKNTNKKLKMAWSRNASTIQRQVINDLLAQLIYVEGGAFSFGCLESIDTLCTEYEKPIQKVTLSPFYITQFEVTQILWANVMGSNPNSLKNNDYPVTNVSWNDVQNFIKQLNHLTSLNFALPTEAQWEYAAKGGNKSKNTVYAGHKDIRKVAWFIENSTRMYHTVGKLMPNELNLYDMCGNVWEWCSDYYAPYTPEDKIDPTGPKTWTNRVYRGGSWLDNPVYSRISYRNNGTPNQKMNCLGFRLILIP